MPLTRAWPFNNGVRLARVPRRDADAPDWTPIGLGPNVGFGPLAEVAHPNVWRGRAVTDYGEACFGRSARRLELTHNWFGNRLFEASCALGSKTAARRL